MISVGSSATTAASLWSGLTRSSGAGAGTASTGTSGDAPAGRAVVSGVSLMRERLFGITDPEVAEPRYTQSNRPSVGTTAGWLTTGDRAFISGLYERAQVTRRDLGDIDALARDLGVWRSTIGPLWAPTVGSGFNMNGDPMVALFDPANERVAQRIRGSQAMYDSGMPTEFLAYQIDPGRGGGGALGLSRLESIMYELSPSGSARSADGGASLPERTPDLLKRMLADGSLQRKSAEAKKYNAENPWEADWRLNDPRDLFEKYEHRVKAVSPMLQEDDKAMLGALYADTEEKHGVDAPELAKIDAFARKLATLRMAGMLLDEDKLKKQDEESGAPRKTLAQRGQEAYDKAMREPVHVEVTHVGRPVSVDTRA